MWVRKRLDIGWRDLIAALGYALLPGCARRARRQVEQLWSAKHSPLRGGEAECPGLATLSARTGWDLWLRAMAFPRGSEIVLSSVTIPEMAQIAELNELAVVPVAVMPPMLGPDPCAIEQAINERTRAILVAHLFGARLDLSPLAEVARKHGLWLIEDCAQAYAGPHWTGNSAADVSLFSFGPIKAHTALGGGVVAVRDPAVRAKMSEIVGHYHGQSRRAFAARVVKYACLKFLTLRPIYRQVARLCALYRCDLDGVVRQSVRNFRGAELLAAIRRRPSAPLLRLLARRIRRFSVNALCQRIERGEQLRGRLQGAVSMPGKTAADNARWLFPIMSDDPASLVAALRASGFDASRNHSLADLRRSFALESYAVEAHDDWLSRTVFLPCYPEMPPAEINRLADCVLTELKAGNRPGHAPVGTKPLTLLSHRLSPWTRL